MKKLLIFSVFPVGAVIALTLLAYGEMQHYYFTDVDTFSLIRDGRSRNLADVLHHFNSELMAGRMVNAVFFRPLTSITLGTEFTLFGMNPRGYHLVSLTIFCLTALLLLRLGTTVWGRGRGTGIGLLASILFVLHPFGIDAVPAIARLGDLLFTFFTLLAVTSALEFMRAGRRRLRRSLAATLSLLAVCLAFLSKEPGVLAPLLVCLAVFVFAEEPTFAARLWRAVRFCVPHFAATVALVLWRSHVLRGSGGYFDRQGGFLHLNFPSLTVKMTILGHIVSPFFSGLTDSFDRYGAAYLVEHKAVIYPLFVLGAAALALAVFPSAVRMARTPYQPQEPPGVTDERVCWIFGGFVVLYFLLVASLGFSSRYLYFSITAFAMLLAIAIFRTGEGIARRETKYGPLAVLVAIVCVVYWYSPGWSKDRLRRWKMSGDVARAILTDLESGARSADGRRIFVLNLPYQVQFGKSIYVSELPTNQLLLDHSLLDYLALRGFEPPHSPDVVVTDYVKLTGPPRELLIKSEFTSATTLKVQVDRGGELSEYPWLEIPGRRHGNSLFRYEGGAHRMQLPPPEGWSNVMTIELMPLALGDSKPMVYAYDGRGLQELSPPELAGRSPVVSRTPGSHHD
jgi:hypothetical protein